MYAFERDGVRHRARHGRSPPALRDHAGLFGELWLPRGLAI